MATWITSSDLRDQAGAKQPSDEPKFVEAVELACAKVEELCGPIQWTTATDDLEVRGSDRGCLKYRAQAQGESPALVSVTTAEGLALTTSDFRVDGQVLRRRDGDVIRTDLVVAYRTGYYDPSVEGAKAPTWARAMAKMIGHQLLRVGRRNQLDQARSEDLTQTHFEVPAAALDVGRDYLLWRGGVG